MRRRWRALWEAPRRHRRRSIAPQRPTCVRVIDWFWPACALQNSVVAQYGETRLKPASRNASTSVGHSFYCRVCLVWVSVVRAHNNKRD